MISLRTLRLTAVVLGCLGLVSAARAQGFDLFHRQTDAVVATCAARGHSERRRERRRRSAELVLRVNRLEEELRQANGRIEELENAEHRLEDQLQKFRQDVEFRFGERSGQAQPPASTVAPAGAAATAAPEAVIEGSAAAKPKKSDAFDPDACRTRRARRNRSERLRRARRSSVPRRRLPERRSSSARDPRPRLLRPPQPGR